MVGLLVLALASYRYRSGSDEPFLPCIASQ